MLYKEDIEDFSKFLHDHEIDKLDESKLLNSLQKLTELLSRHHKKNTFVLVDEYDSCINLLYS